MLLGGNPEKSIIMVSGGPGSGKTIKSLQYTYAAVQRGEPVVYVNLEEHWENKKRYCKNFGWDLDAAENDGLLIALDLQLMSIVNGDVEPRRRKMGINEHSLEYQIIAALNRIGAKHVVLDPLNSLMINFRGAAEIRYLVHKIFETILNLDCCARAPRRSSSAMGLYR